MGLVLAPPYAVRNHHNLFPVLEESFHAERSFWLVAPVDLYRLQRVRVVWNLLREYSERNSSLFKNDDKLIEFSRTKTSFE